MPFAVIPLIQFTNDRKRMGEFANGFALKVAAWICAAVILILDLWLIWTEMEGWVAASGNYRPLVLGGCLLVGIGFCILLAVTVYGPQARRKKVAAERIVVDLPREAAPAFAFAHLLDHTRSARP